MSFFKSITNLVKKVIKPVVGIATGGGSGFDIVDTAKDIYDFAKSNTEKSRVPGRPEPVEAFKAPSFLGATYSDNQIGRVRNFEMSGNTEADYLKYIQQRRPIAYSTLVAAAQSAAGNTVSYGLPKATGLTRATTKAPKYRKKIA
jgi:hypothetical protein